jgi:HD-like signal output (HDOD) protein
MIEIAPARAYAAAPPNPAACRERALKAVGKLPAFSAVLNKLIVSLANDDVSFAELGGLVEKDTVLAGNVLRLVNSAAYARRGTVNSVRHAVSILGLSKLRNATMTWSLARMWNSLKFPPDWSTREFNLHAVASAVLADNLAVESDAAYPEGGFTAGLLQNVGIMLMAVALPEEFTRVRTLYDKGGRGHLDCELSVLGLTHAELSADTLRIWNLPNPIVEAVAAHHSAPGIANLAEVVAAADEAVARQGIRVQSWLTVPTGTPVELFESIGMGERAEKIFTAFSVEFETLRSFFE